MIMYEAREAREMHGQANLATNKPHNQADGHSNQNADMVWGIEQNRGRRTIQEREESEGEESKASEE
jgi:hypothetical protein